MEKNFKSPSEHQIQCAFLEEIAWRFPNVRRHTWATPNEGKRTLNYGKYLKDQGLMGGVFDLFVAMPSNGKHGLFIEFKTLRGRLTADQKLFQTRQREQGYICEVCRSVDNALKVLKNYFKNNPAP